MQVHLLLHVLNLCLVPELVRSLSLCRLWRQSMYICMVVVVLCLVLALLCPCFVVLEHVVLCLSFVSSLFDVQVPVFRPVLWLTDNSALHHECKAGK